MDPIWCPLYCPAAISLLPPMTARSRGEKNFYPSSGFALPAVNILKITTSANKIYKIILDQRMGMRFDAKELEATHQESVSIWQNPLSCI